MDSQTTQMEKPLQTSVSSQPNKQVTILEADPPLDRANSSIKHPLYLWSLEISSSVAALAALVAIIVVLIEFDNRPLPDWPHNITLNTVVSLLQQVLNLGLTIVVGESIAQAKWIWFSQKSHQLAEFDGIDSASSGPWGSFLLLLNPKLIQSQQQLVHFLL